MSRPAKLQVRVVSLGSRVARGSRSRVFEGFRFVQIPSMSIPMIEHYLVQLFGFLQRVAPFWFSILLLGSTL